MSGAEIARRVGPRRGARPLITDTVQEPSDAADPHRHEAPDSVSGPDCLGLRRSDRLVVIQITANATRGIAQKRVLDTAVTRNPARDPGLAPSAVFINRVEVTPENRSFGDRLM